MNHILRKYEHQRPNGTYEFRYQDSNKKRHSIYAETLKELRRKEEEIIRSLLNGLRDAGTMTVNDLYEIWIDLKLGIKGTTKEGYKYLYAHYIKGELGKMKIADIKKSDIKAFYNRLFDKRGHSINTVNNVHIVLRQILNIAVEDNYRSDNPADGALTEIKRLHGDRQKKHALTRAEHGIFESFLLSDTIYRKWYPIFIVLLYTGLRVGELVGLRWCDIDFENNVISVNHTLVYYNRGNGRGCGFAVNSPKTRAGNRLVPMLPKVAEALRMQRSYLISSGIKRDFSIDGYTDFVFLNRFGRPYHQGTLNKALKRIIKACNLANSYISDSCSGSEAETDCLAGLITNDANKNPYAIRNDSLLNHSQIEVGGLRDIYAGQKRQLPHFTNHSLRHTFATRLCEEKINIKAIQAILGHAGIKTTMDIYVDATEALKKSELIKFEESFTLYRPQQFQIDLSNRENFSYNLI